MREYKVIALAGKAGAGKDYLLQEACRRHPEYNQIVNSTTRPKREGEVDGINYYYLTNEEFAQQVLSGEMIQATVFRDWCYGTSINSLDKNKINIGVFNPESIEIIQMDPRLDLKVYYVAAPAKVRLLRQLNREENPDVEEIIRRYKADEDDFSFLDFDYVELPNAGPEDLESALGQLTWP